MTMRSNVQPHFLKCAISKEKFQINLIIASDIFGQFKTRQTIFKTIIKHTKTICMSNNIEKIRSWYRVHNVKQCIGNVGLVVKQLFDFYPKILQALELLNTKKRLVFALN